MALASMVEVANLEEVMPAAEVASLPQVTMPAVLALRSQSEEFRVSTRRPPPTILNPPAIVEVALEVAWKAGKVEVAKEANWLTERLPVNEEVPAEVLVKRPVMVKAAVLTVPVKVGEAERATDPQVPVTSVMRRTNSSRGRSWWLRSWYSFPRW